MSALEITDNPNIEANDYVVARNIAECLQKHYPGHLWGVTCEGKAGIATVRNFSLSGKWGFIIKLSELFGDTEYRSVKRAGGEILERFNLSRGRVNEDRIMELPKMADGMPVFDPAMAKTKANKIIVDAWNKTR